MKNTLLRFSRTLGNCQTLRDAILVFGIFAISRATLSIIGAFSRFFLMPYVQDHYVWNIVSPLWLDIWFFADSAFYIDIAKNGYPTSFTHGQTSSLAFFPLYPILIAATKPLFGSTVLSGVIVSNISYYLGLLYLFMHVAREKDKSWGFRTCLTCSFFPNSFVYSSVYSESLFFFSQLRRYTMRRQRNFTSLLHSRLCFLSRELSAFVSLFLFVI